MDEIPTDMILSEQSVRAGLQAMERIHGRHLGDMSAEEQEQARMHWAMSIGSAAQASAHDRHILAQYITWWTASPSG